jgi:hypothetical protein
MLSSPSLGYRRLLGRASARSEGRQQRASHRIASHRIASHRIALQALEASRAECARLVGELARARGTGTDLARSLAGKQPKLPCLCTMVSTRCGSNFAQNQRSRWGGCDGC